MASAAEEIANGAKTALKSIIPNTDGSSASSPASSLPPHFLGGNSLDVARPGAVRDFVAAHGGHTVITSVSFLMKLVLLF